MFDLKNSLFPMYPHCALICGQTGCGKTEFILDLLSTCYLHFFEHIVIICPTIHWNYTYRVRKWIWTDNEVYLCDLKDISLQEALEFYYKVFSGDQTLIIIDDCAAKKALKFRSHTTAEEKCMISELAFSGRHANQSVWILSQKYNSVLKDFREQLKWICLFYCKDRDSFQDCLKENDVISNEETRNIIADKLKETKHAKLILKTDQPTNYLIII